MKTTAFALALAGLGLACAPAPGSWQDPSSVDRSPPYLRAIVPDGEDVPPAGCFNFRFSEPLDPASLEPAGEAALAGVLALTGRAGSDALERVGRGTLPAEGEGQPVPAAVALAEDDAAVALCPLEPLADEAEYTLVATRRIADRARNPLCRGPDDPTTHGAAVQVRTAFAGPRVLSVTPADGAEQVPPTLAAVLVSFNRPIAEATLDAESVRLLEQGGAEVPFGRFDLLDGGARVRAELPAGRRLALDAEHFVRLSTAILDAEAGRPLVAPFRSRFTTAAELDEAPPVFEAPPSIQADDVEAVLQLGTDEPATLSLTYGHPGALDRELQLDDLVRQRTLRLAPLEPEQEYEARLVVADAGGNQAPPETVGFRTVEARGRPVITEVMANPLGTSDEENGREYVEIVNAGGAVVDLAGFFLDDRGDRSGADPLSLFKGVAGPLELAPGQAAVVVTTAYEEADTLPAGTLLLAVDDSRLGSDGLSRSESVELYAGDPLTGDEPVSSYGGWIAATRDGASVERIDPLAPDVAASWRLREAGGTPGVVGGN